MPHLKAKAKSGASLPCRNIFSFPKSDQFQISPDLAIHTLLTLSLQKFSCNLTSNITQHSMKNLASHSSLNEKWLNYKFLDGEEKIFLDIQKGGSEKIVGLGEGGGGIGSLKLCILQNQHTASSYKSDGFQLNNFE